MYKHCNPYTHAFHSIFGVLYSWNVWGEFGEWTQIHQSKTIQTSHAHYMAVGLYSNSPNFFCHIIYQINFAKHYCHQTFPLYGIWDFNLNFCLKFKGAKLYQRTSVPTPKWSLAGSTVAWWLCLVQVLGLSSWWISSSSFSCKNFEFIKGLGLTFAFTMKVSAPIIILLLLDPSRVTNDTRCVFTKLSANTIEAKISHGKYAGHDHMSKILSSDACSTCLYILLYLSSVHCHSIKFDFIATCCHR